MTKPKIKFGFTPEQIIKEGRVTQHDINTIKHWSKKEKLPKLADEQIILFLLSCENEHEATKATIKSFYHVRKDSPAIFNNRKLEREDLQKQLRSGRFCVFPERTDDGCVIIFFKFHDTYYYNFDFGAFLTLIFMALDAALYESPPTEAIFLYDLQGMGLMHMTRLRIGLLMSHFNYLQEGLPVKLRSIHVLNTVYFIDKIMKLIRPLAKQDVLDKMHFHTSSLNMEEFYEKWIPKKCLPEDYGGEQSSVEELHQKNVEHLTKFQFNFDAEELQRRSRDSA